MDKNEKRRIIKFMVRLQNVIVLYHWSTRTYSKHIASDKLYSDLQDMIDTFIEIYIAKTCASSRLDSLTENGFAMRVNLCNDETFIVELDNAIATLSEEGLVGSCIKGIGELESVRDEMIGSIQRAKYLIGMT